MYECGNKLLYLCNLSAGFHHGALYGFILQKYILVSIFCFYSASNQELHFGKIIYPSDSVLHTQLL